MTTGRICEGGTAAFKRERRMSIRGPCFVPCSAHLLNLVLSDAASCCLEAAEIFNTIQEIYTFFIWIYTPLGRAERAGKRWTHSETSQHHEMREPGGGSETCALPTRGDLGCPVVDRHRHQAHRQLWC